MRAHWRTTAPSESQVGRVSRYDVEGAMFCAGSSGGGHESPEKTTADPSEANIRSQVRHERVLIRMGVTAQ
jgi:hypothetical protein